MLVWFIEINCRYIKCSVLRSGPVPKKNWIRIQLIGKQARKVRKERLGKEKNISLYYNEIIQKCPLQCWQCWQFGSHICQDVWIGKSRICILSDKQKKMYWTCKNGIWIRLIYLAIYFYKPDSTSQRDKYTGSGSDSYT